jgi:tRNA G18 (ribose-2'-O)-methylase SpoU
MEIPVLTDPRNVIDRYKGWATDLIREDVKRHTFPYAVMFENLMGDFNLSSTLRSANSFGAREMYYLGKKKWDKRGAVGTHNYTDIKHIPDHEGLKTLKSQYTFVALEIGVPKAQSIYTFQWPENPLIILGEEGSGITSETLELCDYFVYIPQYGSVRSLNAAVAGSIAMSDFVCKHIQKGI